jgi:hypothetical protein
MLQIKFLPFGAKSVHPSVKLPSGWEIEHPTFSRRFFAKYPVIQARDAKEAFQHMPWCEKRRNPLRSGSAPPPEVFNRHVLFSNAPVLFSFCKNREKRREKMSGPLLAT